MRTGLVVLLFSMISFLGCRNSCQQVCVHMTKYAEECGFTVDSTQLTTCIQEQAGQGSRDDREACRDYNDPEVVRAEWTCDDLALFFSEPEA